MFQVVSLWFIKNGTSEWSAFKTTGTIFLNNHIVFSVVKHNVWRNIALSKTNDKQDEGKTLDSVEVVCL